jgi:hypothetical protein
MKKKFILTPFLLISILFFIGYAHACISFPQIKTKSNINIGLDYDNYNNYSAITELLNSKKTILNLSDSDMTILSEFVINGYSVKEQTDEEYVIFLEEAEKQNNITPEGCGVSYYNAVTHNGRWTGYILSEKYPTNMDWDNCPQSNCIGGGAVTNIIWNDLVPKNTEANDYSKYYYFGAVILIVILVFLILKTRKKS